MHVAIRFFGLFCLAALSLACGAGDDRPPPSRSGDIDLTQVEQYDRDDADLRDIYAFGSCESGQVQTCRIYLPTHNDIQPCFVGEQVCVDGSWGECNDGVLVDANDNDSELDAEAEAP